MLTKVTHISLLVHNQDDALHFYTNILGFKLHTDVIMENGFRWLTICFKNQPDLEVALILAKTPQEKSLVGKQAATYPFICILTDDCKKDYEFLKANGVEFIQEPRQQPWGIEALFKDLYGTVIDICQAVK